MKFYQLLIIAVLSTSVLYGNAAAEYQDDRIFGNGRFLRRLRGETKKPQPKSKDGKTAAKKKTSDSSAKTPTPASRRTRSKTPTPASKRSSGRVPTPAKRPATAKNQKSSKSNSKKSTAKNSDSRGFGMQLEMKSDSLMVAKVDSRGNAREAGVKKGDTIIEAGGAVIGSVEELEEISKILGQGDQLEFKIDRRGKKNTVMIQFGTAPELDEMVESTAKTKNDFSLIRKSDDKQTSATRLVPPASSGTVVGSGLKRVDVQQTIEQQRNQIEQMQKQIERLKNQQTNLNSIIEVPEFRNRADEKASGGPNLSGPGR